MKSRNKLLSTGIINNSFQNQNRLMPQISKTFANNTFDNTTVQHCKFNTMLFLNSDSEDFVDIIPNIQFQNEEHTKDGNIIGQAFPGRNMKEYKRYINPKMEEELRTFKLKIAYRFENNEIPKTYQFPRTYQNDYQAKDQNYLQQLKNQNNVSSRNSNRRFFSQTNTYTTQQPQKSDINHSIERIRIIVKNQQDRIRRAQDAQEVVQEEDEKSEFINTPEMPENQQIKQKHLSLNQRNTLKKFRAEQMQQGKGNKDIVNKSFDITKTFLNCYSNEQIKNQLKSLKAQNSPNHKIIFQKISALKQKNGININYCEKSPRVLNKTFRQKDINQTVLQNMIKKSVQDKQCLREQLEKQRVQKNKSLGQQFLIIKNSSRQINNRDNSQIFSPNIDSLDSLTRNNEGLSVNNQKQNLSLNNYRNRATINQSLDLNRNIFEGQGTSNANIQSYLQQIKIHSTRNVMPNYKTTLQNEKTPKRRTGNLYSQFNRLNVINLA